MFKQINRMHFSIMTRAYYPKGFISTLKILMSLTKVRYDEVPPTFKINQFSLVLSFPYFVLTSSLQLTSETRF